VTDKTEIDKPEINTVNHLISHFPIGAKDF